MFHSIFVPVITPLSSESKVYRQGTDNILEYLHLNGFRGIWLLGSYGSFPLLSEEERMQVAEVGLAKARQLGMTVVVNIGSLNTGMAVRLARHAQDNGAHAVASIVPFYYAASHYREHNFLNYFQEIIRSVQLPVFFYNNEKATGFKPGHNFFRKMLAIGVQGFKSKGDYQEMSEQIGLAKNNSARTVYLSGSTGVHLQGHILGADGVTSGVALAVPKLVSSLQNALEQNNIKEAVRLQNLVLKARNAVGRYVGRAVACYDILRARGVDAGTCRSPWQRMSPDQAQEVVKEIRGIEEEI